MTCLPATVTDPIATVIACAEAAGGPEWASLAILGAQAALALFALAMLVGSPPTYIRADPLTVDEEPFDERGEWEEAYRGAWLGAVILLAVAGLVTGALLWGWPRG